MLPNLIRPSQDLCAPLSLHSGPPLLPSPCVLMAAAGFKDRFVPPPARPSRLPRARPPAPSRPVPLPAPGGGVEGREGGRADLAVPDTSSQKSLAISKVTYCICYASPLLSFFGYLPHRPNPRANRKLNLVPVLIPISVEKLMLCFLGSPRHSVSEPEA